jgi:phosphinothricin acetyltransferase
MHIRPANQSDIAAITAIYNDVIATTNAIYRDDIVDESERLTWYNARIADGYPVIVAESEGEIIGYGVYGSFRFGEGYKNTVEHSIHVKSAHRRKGVGRTILKELIAIATKDGRHVMVGGIDSGNEASINLHKEFGFHESARMEEVAVKGGKLLTLVLMQKILK